MFLICDERRSRSIKLQISGFARKPVFHSSGFPIRSDTNRAVQPRRIDRSTKFRIKEVEGLHYICSENKCADQLCGYRAFVFAYAKSRFSHDMAEIEPYCDKTNFDDSDQPGCQVRFIVVHSRGN